jgi:hypothetical protein
MRRLAVTLLALTAAACATPQFVREPGAPKYKALHYTYPVLVAPRLDVLPEPRQVVGTMDTMTKGGAGDRAKVAQKFRNEARKYGCDAVADVAFAPQEKKSLRTVKVLGKDGRPESRQEEVVTVDYRWTGRCVRTARLGLDPGAAPPPSAPADDQEVRELLASASAEPPEPTVAPPARSDGPAPAAAPAPPVVRDLGDRLARYADGYLRNWKEKFRGGQVDALDVLEAWNELAFQVSGPAGFWRKTVPQSWWGCTGEAPAPRCTKLGEAVKDLARWDRMQAAIGSLDPQQAMPFLKRQQKKLVEYLDTVVPDEANVSAMERTGFYRTHFH